LGSKKSSLKQHPLFQNRTRFTDEKRKKTHLFSAIEGNKKTYSVLVKMLIITFLLRIEIEQLKMGNLLYMSFYWV
jgi:hypothetical protein